MLQHFVLLFAHFNLYLLLRLLRITKGLGFNFFVSDGLLESLIKDQLLVQSLVKHVFISLILNRLCHALGRVRLNLSVLHRAAELVRKLFFLQNLEASVIKLSYHLRIRILPVVSLHSQKSVVAKLIHRHLLHLL